MAHLSKHATGGGRGVDVSCNKSGPAICVLILTQ